MTIEEERDLALAQRDAKHEQLQLVQEMLTEIKQLVGRGDAQITHLQNQLAQSKQLLYALGEHVQDRPEQRVLVVTIADLALAPEVVHITADDDRTGQVRVYTLLPGKNVNLSTTLAGVPTTPGEEIDDSDTSTESNQ